jgi:predicted nucleotidyltransferase
MTEMRFGLSDKIIEGLNSVFRKHPEVEGVTIYGSRAKGNFREGSDIDITLIGSALNKDIGSKISIEIDELNTPYLFDISIFHQLNNKNLEEHIKKHGRNLYTRQPQ